MNRLIHLAGTFASLLSGDLDDCHNATDTTCRAGIAAVSAYWRNLTDPALLIPRVDLYSPFVQMHPNGWSVNRIILHDHFQHRVMAAPATLISNQDTISSSSSSLDLFQTYDFPLLVTNMAVPPSNSWHPYVESVYFDSVTKLAVISILPESDHNDLTVPQIESALGSLDFIHKMNSELIRTSSSIREEPWLPVIFFAQPSPAVFSEFLQAMVNHTHPPAIVLDIEGNALEEYGATPVLISGTTWVSSYLQNDVELHRLDIELEENTIFGTSSAGIVNITLVVQDLVNLPTTIREEDDTYAQDILLLHSLAERAYENDPIMGYSGYMPLTRDDADGTRACMGGECPIGNLFADALRWYTNVDVALIASGGVRGPGWDAGPVRVSDIWNALPFANSVCTGTMLGTHLFELLNYSTSVATYQSTYTEAGDQLLQVSGLKYTYNTLLNTSRLIDIEIYDDESKEYQPIDRLSLYTFATDSYLCGFLYPWKEMLTASLNLQGEVPGEIDEEGLTHQLVVAEYLGSLGDAPYDTAIQGRLLNDTTSFEFMNLVQTEEDCYNEGGSTTWDPDTATCVRCPNQGEKVLFSTQQLDFETILGIATDEEYTEVELINLETFPVKIFTKTIPGWIELGDAVTTGQYLLESGESLQLVVQLTESPTLQPGTALGTISLGVLDGGNYPGCIRGDVTLDVLVKVDPAENLNQLGSFRYIGFSLCTVTMICAISLAVWVALHRKERVVKTLQPPFLVNVCAGIAVIACSLVTLSIDDSLVSAEHVNVACMATPWLLSMGGIIAFAALFSKLWRINKVFNKQFKRIKVTERDVLWPLMILFCLNLGVLLIWTFVDPLQWERKEIPDQPWNTYGTCEGDGTVSKVMLGLVLGINAVALLLACWQAFLARKISDEFSESKYIGIAVFSWFQVLVVACPVLILIGKEDTTTYYLLVISIISVICMSMLFLIFGPLLVQHRYVKHHGRPDTNVRITGVASQGTDAMEPKHQASSDLDNSNNAAALQDELAALQESVTNLLRENGALEKNNNMLKKVVQLEQSAAAFQRSSAEQFSDGVDFHQSLELEDMEKGGRLM